MQIDFQKVSGLCSIEIKSSPTHCNTSHKYSAKNTLGVALLQKTEDTNKAQHRKSKVTKQSNKQFIFFLF